MKSTIRDEKSKPRKSRTNAKINKKLADTDSHVRTAKKWLEENRRKQESIERKEKLQFEMKLVESKLKLSNPTRDLIESGISG